MAIGSSELTSAVDAMQQAEAADTRIGGTRRASKFARGSRGPTANFSESSKKGDSISGTTAPYQLDYYLGDFGEMLIDALEERMETGEYGPVPEELLKRVGRGRRYSPANAAGQPGDGQPGGEPGFGGGPEGPPPDGFGGPGGGPPGGFGGPGGGGPPGGFGGPGGPPGGPSGPGSVAGAGLNTGTSSARRWSNRPEDKEAESLKKIRQMDPCILWLGKDDEREELIKRAEAVKVDVLAIFTMVLNEARTGNFVNNTTTLRLIMMKTGKPPTGYSPEALVNLTVERWRQKDEKGVDPVEREVRKAVEALDKALKPTPLPEAVNAERAKKRIADLVAQKPEDPLPVLVEARFYAAKGFMTDGEFTETAQALLGDSGFEKLKARVKAGDK